MVNGEIPVLYKARLCLRRKKAMVGEGEKKSKREIPLPPPSLPLRHSGYTRPKSLSPDSANMETKVEKDKDEA